ncbi:hypothetical protein [Selenihalanaerobacter shriftii]|uniref:Nickel transport protein n=1 Tax=Selenihalanaerobacter shriftii TaxID=142842 RepID=A0A1T4K0D8_9FIRM|nr:hypothetical protein [Selenihalanaerobacter shriftii]SJZ35946.1 nickel transport protein [Selenihalanaerobacter shriftii]
MKNYKSVNLFSLILMVVIMITLIAMPVYAHRVVAYAYISGDSIVVEAAFGNGAPINEGLVEVYGPKGKLLLEGKTDAKGVYKFKIPQKSDLKIVVGSKMGHQAQYSIKKEELPEIDVQNSTETELSNQNSINEESSVTDINNTHDESTKVDKGKFISKEEFRSILQDELAKQVAPLNKKITQLQRKKGPGITEILGGIGYIFGLMGVVFYFKAKGE